MNSIFGITGIQVKSIYVDETRLGALAPVNDFLDEYDGNIIDIKPLDLGNGCTRYVIIYKAVSD